MSSLLITLISFFFELSPGNLWEAAAYQTETLSVQFSEIHDLSSKSPVYKDGTIIGYVDHVRKTEDGFLVEMKVQGQNQKGAAVISSFKIAKNKAKPFVEIFSDEDSKQLKGFSSLENYWKKA